MTARQREITEVTDSERRRMKTVKTKTRRIRTTQRRKKKKQRKGVTKTQRRKKKKERKEQLRALEGGVTEMSRIGAGEERSQANGRQERRGMGEERTGGGTLSMLGYACTVTSH